MRGKIVAYHIILFLTFSVIGFLLRNYFTLLSLSEEYGCGYSWPNIPKGLFTFHIKFALIIGLYPTLIALLNSLSPLNIRQKAVSIILVGFCGILFWRFRILLLNTVVDINDLGMGFHNFHLNTFLLTGLITGTIASYLTFRKRNSTNLKYTTSA
jgi:hypothetical protein